ncbi:major facilitator superfamily domain-containing protein [Echria macrotheca]|uniref:Major facilitator superfamily domain-containing protein n=1 Tax=Echria macrotheca TaxID=438768 RepID=A0AAJ0B3R3_9PEZI|nr:major facilitator superfamily domain-containing protein [Echria macrotheca]
MPQPDETAPLLANGVNGHDKPVRKWPWQRIGVEARILLAGFLVTLSFSFTQVPIFYAFFLMECDVYYENHPPFEGPGDRCNRNEIAAGTATNFAILGMTTSLCGTLNLFFSGWTVKKFGPRFTMMLVTLVPAIRVATQILGVVAGGQAGINIFQFTQLITVVGGPAGYILVINIIAGELVEPVRRTAVFGMLQGSIMLGQGVGYLTGGMIGDTWGIRRPFEVAFCSFLISAVYTRFTLPYISPESMSDGKKPAVKGIAAFFAPLKVLAPQNIILPSGKRAKHLGVLFLCLGVFLGVIATAYVPLLIQMYATAVFRFRQGDNGFLMSGWACIRALFLLFLFPRIIEIGRKWYSRRHPAPTGRHAASDRVRPEPHLPTNPEEMEAPVGSFADDEPVSAVPVKADEGTQFDLFFLRWSLVFDGFLTMLAALATQKWHVFLAAFLLPFASGTAPAAKGVMTDMCAPSDRADALNALTLVENIGGLLTQGLFGFVFSALAEIGKPYLTFFCNAAVAFLAAGVLVFSRFPPDGSRVADDSNGEEQDNAEDGAHR